MTNPRKRILSSLDISKVVQAKSIDDVEDMIKVLQQYELQILDWLIDFCANIAINESFNKANAKSLSIIFSPYLFDIDENGPNAIEVFRTCPNVLEFLISKRITELHIKKQEINKVSQIESNPNHFGSLNDASSIKLSLQNAFDIKSLKDLDSSFAENEDIENQPNLGNLPTDNKNIDQSGLFNGETDDDSNSLDGEK